MKSKLNTAKSINRNGKKKQDSSVQDEVKRFKDHNMISCPSKLINMYQINYFTFSKKANKRHQTMMGL